MYAFYSVMHRLQRKSHKKACGNFPKEKDRLFCRRSFLSFKIIKLFLTDRDTPGILFFRIFQILKIFKGINDIKEHAVKAGIKNFG